MTKKTIFTLSFIGLGLIIFVIGFSSFINFSNTEIRLRATFDQKTDERTAFYDNMKQIFSMKTQVAVKNDESFRKNINEIMTNRKDADGLMMKWITESNPNANYQEVSALYKDLSRAVESERIGFFNQEKVLQDIVRQHSELIQTWPGSFYNIIFGRTKLEYKVIQSDNTARVMESGRDNDTKLDL